MDIKTREELKMKLKKMGIESIPLSQHYEDIVLQNYLKFLIKLRIIEADRRVSRNIREIQKNIFHFMLILAFFSGAIFSAILIKIIC